MNIHQIEANDLFKIINESNLLIIDVREQSEYRQERLEHSINIPLSNSLLELNNIEDIKNKKIILYCRAGVRSMVAATKLQEDGFENDVSNLTGGLNAWKDHKLPLLTDYSKSS
jgi:rhodanese-related sulfurtransferase